MAGYQALYRQWRPRCFADVVGQEHVTRSLRHALQQGRVAHAYLFCGPRGTGKTTVARILAQALVCQAPKDGESCGECGRCEAAAADRLLAIEEIDAASHRGIDDVRALRERVAMSPGDVARRVHIIDEVHMLTSEAFNALLKTLEEPPADVFFILATTDPRKLPATILSRCQRFDFHRLSDAQIANRLAEVAGALGAEVDGDALATIALRADGGMRDALGILDQCLVYADGRLRDEDVATVLGTASREQLNHLADAISSGDAAGVWRAVGELYEAGRDLAQVTRDLIGFWRRRWADGSEQDRRAALPILEKLLSLEGELRRGAPARVAVEVALARLARDNRDGKGESAARPPALEPAAPPAAPPATERVAPQTAGPGPERFSPRSAAARRGGDGDLGLDVITRQWDEILASIPKPNARAILRDARPATLGRGVLTLGFQHDFHLGTAERDGHLKLLSELLSARFGVPLEVRGTRDSGPSEAGGAEVAAAPSPPVDTEDALADLPAQAREFVNRAIAAVGEPVSVEWIEANGHAAAAAEKKSRRKGEGA